MKICPPPVKVRAWFRIRVRIRVGGGLSSGAIVLEPNKTTCRTSSANPRPLCTH